MTSALELESDEISVTSIPREPLPHTTIWRGREGKLNSNITLVKSYECIS